MCGIAFISPAPDSHLPTRALTRHLLHSLADRGRHASGVAWKRPDGVTLYRKMSGHPVRLAAHLAARTGTKSLDGAAAVLVHTRHATVGPPDVTENNHPIVRPGVAMVHNGHVRNTAELYRIARAPRLAEVDSDALAALIETAPSSAKLADRFARVQGLAAVAWLEVDDDKTNAAAIYAARIDTRPLVIAETTRGDLIGASTLWAIESAARIAGVTVAGHHVVPEGRMYLIDAGQIVDRWHLGTGSGKVENVTEYARRA